MERGGRFVREDGVVVVEAAGQDHGVLGADLSAADLKPRLKTAHDDAAVSIRCRASRCWARSQYLMSFWTNPRTSCLADCPCVRSRTSGQGTTTSRPCRLPFGCTSSQRRSRRSSCADCAAAATAFAPWSIDAATAKIFPVAHGRRNPQSRGGRPRPPTCGGAAVSVMTRFDGCSELRLRPRPDVQYECHEDEDREYVGQKRHCISLPRW